MIPRLLLFCAALTSALPLAAQLTGYVYGSDNKPLKNLVVRAHRPETVPEMRERLAAGVARKALATSTTDETGAFSLDTKANGVIGIVVAADGYRPVEQRELADEKDVVIVVQAAKSQRGRITANGKPLANATIVAAGTTGSITTATDARGEYMLPELGDWAWGFAVFHPATSGTGWNDGAALNLDLRVAPVKGRVVHANGKPAAGAKLFVSGWPAGKSGDDGTFSLPLSAGAGQIRARLDEFKGIASRNGEELVIALEQQRMLDVTARDAKETPIAGVVVIATDDGGDPQSDPDGASAGVTDEKGRVHLRVRAGEPYITATASSGVQFNGDIADTRQGDAQVELVAETLPYVRGFARDEEQRPVAGAIVFPAASTQTIIYSATKQQQFGISAADGSFRVPIPWTSFDSLRVIALHRDYAAGESVPLDSEAARQSLIVTMPQGITVEGTVVNAQDKPAEGVAMFAMEQGKLALPQDSVSNLLTRMEPWVRTDAAGRFSLRLRPRPHSLALGGPRHQPLLVEDVEPKRSMEPLRIVIEEGVEIRGRITRKGARRPDEPAQVAAVPADYEGRFYTMPDAEGRFAFTSLRPGTYRVSIGNVMRVVRAPATDVVLELAEKVEVRGRVVDKASGAPITRFGVTASALSDETSADSDQFEDAEGRFTLPVVAGRMRIEASAPGYLPGEPEFVTVDAQHPPGELRLALQRGRTIRGRVTDTSGKPVEASVMLFDGDGESTASANVNDEGNFEITAAPFGALSMLVDAQQYVMTRKPVAAGEADLRIDVEVSKGLTVTGRVVKEDGSPVAEVNVEASTAAHDAGQQYAQSDAGGRFEIQGLSETIYSVSAGGSDGFGAIENVDPRTAGPLVLTLRKPAKGTIRGTVTGLSGTPRGDVVATSLDGPVATGRIDRDGHYVIMEAPVGLVTVRATADVGRTRTVSRLVTVEVPAGGEATADLVFNEGISVRGAVTRNGQPVVAADVLFRLERESHAMFRTTTGDDGRYELAGLERGMYLIMAGLYDVNTSRRQLIDSASTIDLQLDPARIEGRVIGDDRSPLANVSLDVTRLDDDSTAMATSDANGVFSAPAIGGASYRLFPSLSGYTGQAVDVAGGGDPVVIAMTRSDALKVRVVDGRTGATIDGWAEAVDDAGRIVARSGQTAADGAVRLPVGRGTFRISASAPGFASQSTRVSVPSSTEVRIAIRPGGTVEIEAPADSSSLVRFLLPNGDAYIHCLCEGQRELRLGGALTRIASVAAGSYTLQLVDANGRASRGYPVTVREGEITRVRVE